MNASDESFEQAVVRLEDQWVDAGDESRNDILDYVLFERVLRLLGARGVELVRLEIQPTMVLPRGWQTGIMTPHSVGGLRGGNVCLSGECRNMLRRAILGCVETCLTSGRRAVTVIAYDAASGTGRSRNLIPNEGHVHSITCSRVADGTLIHALEPTVPAPWFENVGALLDRYIPVICDEASKRFRIKARYAGLVYGVPFSHGNLCRYKVAVDSVCAEAAELPPLEAGPISTSEFRRLVMGALSKMH